jgi:hypothetical protein
MDLVKEKFEATWLKQIQIKNKYFKLPQPCSIDLSNINLLRLQTYMVCEKSDGTRNCLFFTRTSENEPVIYSVDRNMEFVPLIHTEVHHNLFAGTICDCELVENTFVIFDCIAITGTSVGHYDLNKRLMHGKTVTRLTKLKHYKLATKQFVLAADLMKLLKVSKAERTDGFVFTPLYKPVSVGTVYDCLKWKPVDKQTVDLCVRQTVEDGKYSLHASDGEIVNVISVGKGILRVALQLAIRSSKLIVECNYTKETKDWFPIFINGSLLLRKDKPTANSTFVIKRTAKAIRDNIKPEDIVQLCKNNRY